MAHIVLVPGFWLGAWAWDDVARPLRAAGHQVTAVTLPGLESVETDRSAITLADHVDAVAGIVRASPEPVVLVAHSGGGASVYAVTDLMPEKIALAIYVDSGPLPNGIALGSDLPVAVTELPLPSWPEILADGTSLDGLDEEMLAAFAARAVPEPAGPIREPLQLSNPARYSVSTVLIASSFSAEQIRTMAAEGMPFFSELTKFEAIKIVELPTGHWPMFSRPADLAAELAKVAAATS